MAAVMGVNQARQKGAKDALFVTNDNKYILEGEPTSPLSTGLS